MSRAHSSLGGKTARSAHSVNAALRPVAKLPNRFLGVSRAPAFRAKATPSERTETTASRDDGPFPVGGPKEPYGNSVDFYDEFHSDIKRAANLGVNVYRSSVNWTRVELRPGKFSPEELRFYDRSLATMRHSGSSR